MRKLMAFVALLCGAASAQAGITVVDGVTVSDKWCSSGFDAPAVLSNHNGMGYILKIGDRTEVFDGSGPVGTGMNGRVLPTGEVVNSAEIVNDVAPRQIPAERIAVLIFRDRVFWPCD